MKYTMKIIVAVNSDINMTQSQKDLQCMCKLYKTIPNSQTLIYLNYYLLLI